MKRSFLVALVCLPFHLYGQSTCPALQFTGQQTVSLQPTAASHLDLIQQTDGSWTAFEVNNLDAGFVVATPHFENQVARCLPAGTVRSGSAQPGISDPLTNAYVLAPALIAPGMIFVPGIVSQNGTVPFTVLDTQHQAISSAALALPAGSSLTRIGVAEATGDGKLDVLGISQTLSGGTSSETLYIFPGRGDGTFGDAITRSLPAGSSFLGVADLNGDGVPDVLAQNSSEKSLMVGLTSPTGELNMQAIALPSGFVFYPSAFRVGDLNGDKHPDIVLGGLDDTPAGRVVVFLGDGKGGFGPAAVFGPFTSYGPAFFTIVDLAIGDLNADGTPDIATSSGAILFGDGKGGFPESVSYAVYDLGPVRITDLNRDGINDLVFGSGTGAFVSSSFVFASADLLVLYGMGGGRFSGAPVLFSSSPRNGVTQMTAGNFDGRGRSGVAAFSVSSGTSTDQVKLTVTKATNGQLAITHESSVPHAAGFFSASALSGDFNGDKSQDLLLLIRNNAGDALWRSRRQHVQRARVYAVDGTHQCRGECRPER